MSTATSTDIAVDMRSTVPTVNMIPESKGSVLLIKGFAYGLVVDGHWSE